MANEFRKVTDQNGVDHPVTDDTRVTWTANGVLGAKNIFNFANVVSGSSYVSGTDKDFSIQGTGQYVSSNFEINVKRNTRYKITTSVVFTSGGGAINVLTTGGTTVAQSGAIDESKNVSFAFDSGENDKLKIATYCTRGTSTTGNVEYKNFMVTVEADTDPTYQPYAMTNKELTDAVNYSYRNPASAINALVSEEEWDVDQASIHETEDWVDLNFWIINYVSAINYNLDLASIIPTNAKWAGAPVGSRNGNPSGICWIDPNSAVLRIRIPAALSQTDNSCIISLRYYKK